MKLKGHTKIELFDAKTKELVDCVEDDNMFTNALDNMVNNILGAAMAGLNSYLFPLYTKALGAIMLLPNSEVEDVNNVFPHSIPTAVGAYNVTDAADDPLCGIYNAAESGPIEGGYKHVWEYLTSQGNGLISCACLTNYYSYISAVNSNLIYSGYGVNYATSFPRRALYTSLGGNCCVAGKKNGKVLLLSMLGSGNVGYIHDHPSLYLHETNIIVDEMNKITDDRLGGTLSKTLLAQVDLTEDYTQIFANESKQYDGRYYYESVWSCYPYTENECIIMYGIMQKDPTMHWGYGSVFPWMDVYKLNLSTYQIEFIRTIYFPTATLPTIQGGWVVDTNTNKSRPIPTTQTSYGQLGGTCLIPFFHSLTSEGIYGYNGHIPVFYPDSAELVYLAVTHSINSNGQWPSDMPSIGSVDGLFIVKINVLTGVCQVKLVEGIMVGWVGSGQSHPVTINTIGYSIQKLGDSPIISATFGNSPRQGAAEEYHRILINKNDLSYQLDKLRSSWTTNITQTTYVSNFIPLFSAGTECIGLEWECNNYYNYNNNKRHNLCRGGFYNYMATINNLPTPITKTSDQTMKVTYTIMDAEEGV